MSSASSAVRLSTSIARRSLTRCRHRRAFHASHRTCAASNYTMPALSPTMTEGNIAAWRVKEGDSYTAGDVILEIETDKATMDVEAQDDGMLFKITQPDGAKGVKVGQRIAVMAEEGDDLSSMELPAEEVKQSEGKKEDSVEQKQADRKTDSASPAKEASNPGGSKEIDSNTSDPTTMQKPYAEQPPTKPGKSRSYQYPLYPSVQQLLHENGQSDSDAAKIPATGPNGRLLKGDVLAYLGQIKKEYPSELSSRLEKLTHLDLTHVVAAKPAQSEMPAKESQPTQQEIQMPSETEVAVPISLSAVIATQKRVQDSLGIFLPLSTFIARASELANEDLPARKGKAPSADELFESVLGMDKVSMHRYSRGHFFPQITGISPAPSIMPARNAKKADIIDILAGGKKPTRQGAGVREVAAALGVSAGDNIFSVTASNGEEQRATEYLERLKLALEKEPGRLVL